MLAKLSKKCSPELFKGRTRPSDGPDPEAWSMELPIDLYRSNLRAGDLLVISPKMKLNNGVLVRALATFPGNPQFKSFFLRYFKLGAHVILAPQTLSDSEGLQGQIPTIHHLTGIRQVLPKSGDLSDRQSNEECLAAAGAFVLHFVKHQPIFPATQALLREAECIHDRLSRPWALRQRVETLSVGEPIELTAQHAVAA